MMNYFESDSVKAVREASISIATLLDEHCNNPLKKDLEHIQKQITILENSILPNIPNDNSESSQLATP